METENQTSPLSPWPAPAGLLRAYHAMVKPIGSISNLDGTYCYYLHKKDLLGSTSRFCISDIRQYIEGQDRSEVVFSWQGGESTLLGLDFFRKVVELEQKYKKPNQRIENDLQTNGMLLDDEFSEERSAAAGNAVHPVRGAERFSAHSAAEFLLQYFINCNLQKGWFITWQPPPHGQLGSSQWQSMGGPVSRGSGTNYEAWLPARISDRTVLWQCCSSHRNSCLDDALTDFCFPS
jgi:hypothetical protein